MRKSLIAARLVLFYIPRIAVYKKVFHLRHVLAIGDMLLDDADEERHSQHFPEKWSQFLLSQARYTLASF
jgi:hypothetical protein